MTVKTFISRPLLSLVISVFIVLLGVISLLSLPVERYPDIAPPAIYVWASYPGASAETVQKSVVMPLEEAINGVEGMTYMISSASNGSASITIYFEQGANADMAAVNVQNRVIQAQAQLPAEVLQTGVGANGSRTIGVCVVGGMMFGTLGLLLTVPVLFVVFQKIQERTGKDQSDL
jgi:multidrug efflux pump subunit AcrB